ncbi:MAG: hypothetical protein ACLR5G_01880 [Eubacteriales bacterium]
MKLIRTDSAGRITGFRTSISGELIRAIAEHDTLPLDREHISRESGRGMAARGF